jgi:hypothetical protein
LREPVLVTRRLLRQKAPRNDCFSNRLSVISPLTLSKYSTVIFVFAHHFSCPIFLPSSAPARAIFKKFKTLILQK